MDAFGVERAEVSKDMAAVRTAARMAPIKAQLKLVSRGHALSKAPKRGKRALGYALRELGYRPDYAASIMANAPGLLARTA
jgi:hypothetical protein